MIKFKDLEFKKMKVQNGIQAMVDFDNGFTASIVKHDHSYGGKSGLFISNGSSWVLIVED